MVKAIEVNERYIPLVEDKSRFLILYGGSGSGKSVFAAFKICFRVLTETPHKFLVLRKVGETVKDSVFAEIKEMFSIMSCLDEFDINKTDKTFTHRGNGNQILCKGLDEPEKIKSIKGITGMWVEEATEFSSDEIDQLNLRIRGQLDNYIQYILSFNPISEDNEIVKKFVTSTFHGATVVHTTYKDNSYLTAEDIAQIEGLKEKNPLYYDVYCLGIPGVVDKSGKFLYSFNPKNQVVKGLQYEPNLPLWASFDFNIDPMTVTIAQRINMRQLNCLQTIQLNDSDIYAVCDRIQADYPGKHLVVTGDASGNNRTGVVRGKKSYWQVIKEELKLRDVDMKVRSINLGLIESRVLCNAVNQSCDIFFDEDNCKQLINDCKYGKVDDKGVLIKDRKKQKMDFLDNLRYLVDANFPDYLNKPKRYK